MTNRETHLNSSHYDPDLPTASAVMASLCCVAAQYAKEPSMDLAVLATSLAHTLTAPEYAETELIVTVAKRLVQQWAAVLNDYQRLDIQQPETQQADPRLTDLNALHTSKTLQ